MRICHGSQYSATGPFLERKDLRSKLKFLSVLFKPGFLGIPKQVVFFCGQELYMFLGSLYFLLHSLPGTP